MNQNNRRGNWMQTVTGRAFWPTDPHAEDMDAEDIAHALACQNRFAGHTRAPYSVAEHCCHVHDFVARRFREKHGDHVTPEHFRRAKLAALLHDGPEAYLVDLPRPVKHHSTLYGYREIEERVAQAMERWAGLPYGAFEWAIVKRADEVLLATEKRDLMAPEPQPWTLRAEALPRTELDLTWPWDWRRAKDEFSERFRELVSIATPVLPPPYVQVLRHYHSCPRCYQKNPCDDSDCAVFDDLSEDGVMFGHHTDEGCEQCTATGANEPRPDDDDRMGPSGP